MQLDHRAGTNPAIGTPHWTGAPCEVVLCNFGGPESEAEVEPFLRRLFEDPFIIRSPWLTPRLRRWLARRIARRRAPRIAEEYAAFGYSPSNRIARTVAEQLQRRLGERHPDTKVHVCNRYVPPLAEEIVTRLDVERSRLFLIALYPHLCHSTTVSSFRDFDLAMRARYPDRAIASVRVDSWWFAPRYLDLWTRRIRQSLATIAASQPGAPVQVLFSAHGIPERYDQRGDPYVNAVRANFLELQRRVTHADRDATARSVGWHLSFQSRVGPVAWVRPYTDETIVALGRKTPGAAILLVPISFTSDHIETLFEMDQTYKDLALASGFAAYHRVATPGDDPVFVDCLYDILLGHGF